MVLQFTISMIMLICTWVVYSQLSYLRKKDVGFNKDQVMTITVNTGEDERGKIFAMNNELRNLPGIKEVGSGNSYPGAPNINLNLFTVQTNSGTVDKAVECYSVDEHYFVTLGIRMVKGRNFSNLGDTLHSIVVNEAMVKHFGWDEPLGKRIKFPGDTSGNYLEVVGVFKDFNQKSLYNPIAPLLLFYGPNGNVIQIKMDAEHLQPFIAKVEARWKKYFPSYRLNTNFWMMISIRSMLQIKNAGEFLQLFLYLPLLLPALACLGLQPLPRNKNEKRSAYAG